VRTLLLSLAAFATFAFVVPAAASAGDVSWRLRDSWVTYVTRWGGTTVGVSPASYSSSTRTVTSPQVGSGSGDVAAFDGGFRSRILLHGVDIQIVDLSIDFATGDVKGSGWYTPLLSSRRTFSDWSLFTLTGGARSSGAGFKAWTGATPRLTANGATVFNGGDNGSYAAGEEFGTLSAEGDF